MEQADVAALTRYVLWAGFGLSFTFGALAQRTHFCTMGAVADIVNIGDWSRMRMWALAIGTAIVGFNAMVALGWIEARHSVYAAEELIWLSNALGGLVFGFGMVLASGCGSKTLVRVGGGNLKALVVLLVLAASGFATMRGVAAVWRVESVDRAAVTLEGGQDLPSLLASVTALPVPALAAVLGLEIGGALVGWALMRQEGRSADVLVGGFGIGLVVVAVWWVSGQLGFVPEHADTLEPTFLATNTRHMESLSFIAPAGYALDWLLYYSDANKRLTLGVVSVVGVIAGSAAWALVSGRFRWEGFASVEDLANHLVGAVLMGVGGVTAFGCTIGQGITGVSTLALGSFIALAGILAGAVLGVRYQAWRLERLV
ncbi:MAG: YeeE/YedE family protein [Burkholderiaceae bacterium]|nr:YeeE/YedE family protein [Burkholderiaceae bacterium]